MTGSPKERGVSRFAVDFDSELYRRFSRVDYGIRTAVIRALVKMVVEAFERDGMLVIGAILSGDIEFRVKVRKDRT